MNKVECGCGTDTYLKKDGSFWKHQTPDGVACVTPTENPSAEYVVEKSPTEYATENPPEEESPAEYSIEIRMHSSLYPKDDVHWHQANKDIVIKKAQLSGEHTVGPGMLREERIEGEYVVLTYSVLTKGVS